MKKIFTLILIALSFISFTQAQQKPATASGTVPLKEEPAAKTSNVSSRTIVPESSVITNHTVNIKGKAVPYKATTGTLPVWDEEGKPIAGLFYTYYERSDIQNKESRPLVISFNGGPGSASVWMHIAYTGPVVDRKSVV